MDVKPLLQIESKLLWVELPPLHFLLLQMHFYVKLFGRFQARFRFWQDAASCCAFLPQISFYLNEKGWREDKERRMMENEMIDSLQSISSGESICELFALYYVSYICIGRRSPRKS